MKYPEKGKVKSRLSSKLNDDITIQLYRMFVHDLLNMLKKTNYPILICYHPENALDRFNHWLGTNHCYVPQPGGNLGKRMKNSFNHSFMKGFKKVIVIGSDSPDLPCKYIGDAFKNLEKQDAVIGPCPDGGYYLLGLTQKSFSTSFFEGINWSTRTVFQETIHRLSKEKLNIHILPEWRDVDTFDDLLELVKRNQDKEFNTSETITFLLKHLD